MGGRGLDSPNEHWWLAPQIACLHEPLVGQLAFQEVVGNVGQADHLLGVRDLLNQTPACRSAQGYIC